MTKYLALLRGINVGGRIIKMADLKLFCEDIGLKNVKTVLQTGNVLFESPLTAAELKRQLEPSLTEAFKYSAKVQVYDLVQVVRIVKDFPLQVGEPGIHHYVVFTEHGLTADLSEAGYKVDEEIESIQIVGEVVYWNVQKGMTLKSGFAKTLNKSSYKDRQTVRNIKTLQKLIN